MKRKQCAWISRHDPSNAQRSSLRDYTIHKIDPAGRLWSAGDAVSLSQGACGGWPDLYVVVMPMTMLRRFAGIVNGQVPIIRAVYYGPEWTGHWQEVLEIRYVTREWIPERHANERT